MPISKYLQTLKSCSRNIKKTAKSKTYTDCKPSPKRVKGKTLRLVGSFKVEPVMQPTETTSSNR